MGKNRQMRIDAQAPFEVVREAFWQRVGEAKGRGYSHDCPCCGQHAKIYKRTIHAGMAAALIRMYQMNVTDNGGWIPVSEIYARGAAGDYAKLRYWSLVESADARGAVKNASGFWRLTDRGKRFVEGQLRLPKYALVFDNNVLGHEGALVTIHECLGKRFSYVSLMAQ